MLLCVTILLQTLRLTDQEGYRIDAHKQENFTKNTSYSIPSCSIRLYINAQILNSHFNKDDNIRKSEALKRQDKRMNINT